jgi:hypothetical protein
MLASSFCVDGAPGDLVDDAVVVLAAVDSRP